MCVCVWCGVCVGVWCVCVCVCGVHILQAVEVCLSSQSSSCEIYYSPCVRGMLKYFHSL